MFIFWENRIEIIGRHYWTGNAEIFAGFFREGGPTVRRCNGFWTVEQWIFLLWLPWRREVVYLYSDLVESLKKSIIARTHRSLLCNDIRTPFFCLFSNEMNFYVFLWSEVFFVVTIWKKNNCEHQTEHTELGACVIFLLGGRSLNMVSVSMKKPNCSFRKRKNNVRAMFSVLNILCGYLLRIYFIFEKGRSSNIFSENVKNHLFLSDFVVVTVARNIYICMIWNW